MSSGSQEVSDISKQFADHLLTDLAAPLEAGLLSVREVAASLRISTRTVYDLCASGRLTHVRVANAIRVAPQDVVVFIERSRG